MKKITVFLMLLFCAGFSLSARVSWDLEAKGYAGFNFVNEKYLFQNNQYNDFLLGAGIQSTVNLGPYIGLDLFFGYSPLCYPTPKLAENNWYVADSLVDVNASLGLAIMIPLTERLELKTVIGGSMLMYTRHDFGTYEDENGNKHSVANEFKNMGSLFKLSAGCIWWPYKHLGVSFGSDFAFFFGKGAEGKLAQSGYIYDKKYLDILATPYLGLVLRVGRKR